MRLHLAGAVIATAFLALAHPPAARAQTLAADYRLQDTLASSVGAIGPLTPVGGVGGVTFMTDTVDAKMQRVLNIQVIGMPPTTTDSGVRTQTNPFVDSSNYSIVLLANFNLNQSAIVATKIFDFKNLSGDAGLYVQSNTGTLAFIDNSGVLQNAPGGAALSSLMYAQIVLARDGVTNLVSVYQDGTLAFSFTDTNGLAILGDATMTGNSFLTLFKDDGTGLAGGMVNEGTQGNLARLRFYNGVLSAQQVAGLDRAIPEPSTWALLVLGLAAALYVTRLKRAVS